MSGSALPAWIVAKREVRGIFRLIEGAKETETIATLPTAEQSARAILGIFKTHNVRAGQVLMAGAVNVPFLQSGYQAEDYAAGLKYAEEKGWLEAASPTAIRPTEAGFAAM